MRRFFTWRLFALFIFAALVAATLFFLPDLRDQLRDLTEWVRDNTLLGMLIFANFFLREMTRCVVALE